MIYFICGAAFAVYVAASLATVAFVDIQRGEECGYGIIDFALLLFVSVTWPLFLIYRVLNNWVDK